MRQNLLVLLSIFTLFVLFAHVSLAQDTGNTSEGNDTPPPPPPPDPEPEPPIYDTSLVDYFPKQVNIGDSQLNLYVQNTGNQDLNNLIAIITGEGISTYDVTPIETLKPDQKSYLIARLNAKTAGVIQLSIKILDDTFERKLVVRDPKAEDSAAAQRKEEERRQARLAVAAVQLENLTGIYDDLEEQYYAKKNAGFDVSNIDLRDGKTYLRNSQASYAQSDVDQTEANLVLLQNELEDIRSLLDYTQKPKRGFMQWIKDNSTIVITIGYVLGIIISLFTIIELVKKNKSALAEQERHKPVHVPNIEHPPAEKRIKEKPMEHKPIPKRVVKSAKRVHKPAPRSVKRSPRKAAPMAVKSAQPPRAAVQEVGASKKYKINKAKPQNHYAVRPAEDDF